MPVGVGVRALWFAAPEAGGHQDLAEEVVELVGGEPAPSGPQGRRGSGPAGRGVEQGVGQPAPPPGGVLVLGGRQIAVDQLGKGLGDGYGPGLGPFAENPYDGVAGSGFVGPEVEAEEFGGAESGAEEEGDDDPVELVDRHINVHGHHSFHPLDLGGAPPPGP